MAKVENNSEKKKATRFLIVPIKKHLAHFLIIDWEKVRSMIPESEIELYHKSLTNPKKIGRYFFPRLINEESLREMKISMVVRFFLRCFFNEQLIIEDILSKKQQNYTFEYYRNRHNLKADLLPFLKSGYSLLKIKVHVRQQPNNLLLRQINKGQYNVKVNELNRYADSVFMEYVCSKIKFTGNIDIAIDEIFNVLGLNDSILKKSTLKRRYFKFREKEDDDRRLFDSKNIHAKIFDKTLFDIYADHFKHNISYSQLAIKYKYSKSTIARICNNNEVIKLYNEVTKYNTDYMDWLIDSPIKKQ